MFVLKYIKNNDRIIDKETNKLFLLQLSFVIFNNNNEEEEKSSKVKTVSKITRENIVIHHDRTVFRMRAKD